MKFCAQTAERRLTNEYGTCQFRSVGNEMGICSVSRPAVLLDRDGLLVEEVYYPHTREWEAPLRPEDVRRTDRPGMSIAAICIGCDRGRNEQASKRLGGAQIALKPHPGTLRPAGWRAGDRGFVLQAVWPCESFI